MARILNKEQSQVLEAAVKGHNLFVTGQAFSGKSFVVKGIFKRFTLAGKRVCIIFSSGIATTVYSDLNTEVSTVHSFFGLQTADLPYDLVVDRSTSNNIVIERVANYDCLIWDEVSMSSRRILQLVNEIQLLLTAPDRDHANPLAGKQVILVGEFLQLRLVPSLFDEGEFLFRSPIFQKAFPHRFSLTQIMRQDENLNLFLQCLKELRLGQCSDNTLHFLRSLSRPLQPASKDPVHIFFRRIPMEMYNLDVLLTLPGELITFKAVDSKDTRNIKCSAERILLLKPGALVMLVWNKSRDLKNGSQGVFIETRGEVLFVDFQNAGRVAIQRETWQKCASDDRMHRAKQKL